MIKKMLMNWLLPVVIDTLIAALQMLSKKTTSAVDDKVVDTVMAERDQIISEIKASL